MDILNIPEKLCALRNDAERLNEDDRAFILEMVALHEAGGVMNRHQVLRVVDMRVPRENDSG